jgi:2-C-methyl-D-erythritol 4-phosphate cytidylyltransferase
MCAPQELMSAADQAFLERVNITDAAEAVANLKKQLAEVAGAQGAAPTIFGILSGVDGEQGT